MFEILIKVFAIIGFILTFGLLIIFSLIWYSENTTNNSNKKLRK